MPAVAGKPRLAQLATIRAHGQRELATRHEAQAAARRNQWVIDLIAAKPRAGHTDERQWFKAVEDDFATIRGTLHDTLRVRRDPTGCVIAGRLTMFWYFHGLVPEGGRWYSSRPRRTSTSLPSLRWRTPSAWWPVSSSR